MEEHRRQQKEAERLEKERQMFIELENQAEQWAKANRLRDYIQAVNNAAKREYISKDLKITLNAWLIWAHQHADNIDPLKGC